MKSAVLSIISYSSLLTTLGMASSAWADVDYQIDLKSPEHHLAEVKVTFPQHSGQQLKVNLPVWRTGKYQVLPLADGVRRFHATDEQGNSLPWKRSASGEWTVVLSKPTAVTVSYQLYANELGQRVRHIDASHAFLDASGVFIYSPEFRQEPLKVTLDVPSDWRSYSGMAAGDKPHSFVAANYDVLVDSPIETGLSQHRAFKADGKQYELVVWGEGNYDLEQIEADLGKLSATAAAIWDDYPFERYVYMVHATSGARGATEHLNSTIIQLPRFNFRERQDYLRFISTASHEFIHTWNVKAYRPEGLVPYDYQQENMTELLWMAEGSTSYFQNQLLLRAGIMTPKEFMEDLAKRVNANQHKPGREIQSVAEASAGQWVSTGGDYAINHSVNIYSEGYLTSLALDFSLLQDTDKEVSYRDVHRSLYREHKVPKGYNVTDVKRILKNLSGKDYESWWQSHVNAPLVLDFDKLLSQAGLKTAYGKDSKEQAFAGMTLTSGSLVLQSVERGGPAWQAGIVAGDQLLAINGLKVSAEGYAKRLADFDAGDELTVTLFHDDKLIERRVTLASEQSGKLQIKPKESVSRAQKAFFKAWLGIDWPFDAQGNYKS